MNATKILTNIIKETVIDFILTHKCQGVANLISGVEVDTLVDSDNDSIAYKIIGVVNHKAWSIYGYVSEYGHVFITTVKCITTDQYWCGDFRTLQF